jgi:hypothetical protein
MPGITVVIPAFNEASRVGDTVRAAAGLPGVDLVLVVDDGSSDGTRPAAEGAGAAVLRHDRNRGKGAALETGAEAARLLGHAGPLLFLDADLGATAANAGPLITPVTSGAADMTIAVFRTLVKLGGHGIVVRTARSGIRRATGWNPQQPLNGQRCLSRAAFDAARPLARGFGVETGLSIDLLRRGMRVVEVEVDMAHRATGTDFAAQLHRARQLADVGRALAPRLFITQRARYISLCEFACAVCDRVAAWSAGDLFRSGRLRAIVSDGPSVHGAGARERRLPRHGRPACAA